MAAPPRDVVLDPKGTVLVNLATQPLKRTRRVFTRPLERKEALAESKRKSEQSRITLGNQWPEWERQRMLCGFQDNKEFVAHLLAVHQARCPQFCQVTASLHAISGDTDNVQVECVPETPSKKRKGKCEDDSFESPVIPIYKKGTSTYQSALSACQSSSTIEQQSDSPSVWQSADTSAHQTPTTAQLRTPPAKGTNNRGPVYCSTPVAVNQPTSSIIPEDEVAFLTPIKEEQPRRRRRLAMERELPHSPALYEDDSESDEDLAEKHFHDVTDFANSDESEDDEPIPMPETNWRNLRVTMGTNEAIEDRKCIAFSGVLEKLLRVAIGENCRLTDCKKPLKFIQKKRGTCLLILWECPNKAEGRGHFAGVWSSQPRVHGMDGGTLLTSTALVLSGNNYGKIALLAKFLKLNFMSKQDHNCIQRRYIEPAVKAYWEKMQTDLLSQVTAPLVLAGDGRNDSPGHCSKYLTYSLLDTSTKKIVALSVVDCLETDLNSVIMERVGFQRAMDQVLGKVPVAEVVTDAHPQIRKLMRTDARYKAIEHQWDVWHVAKNMAKKLVAAGRERGMGDILPWIPSIKTHLWYASRTCGGNADKLRMVWQSVLYHVCNKHEWLDTTGHTAGHCNHEIPLPEQEGDRAWIKPGSKAQERLIQLVRKKQFVSTLSYLTNFRHTGDLELFHSHLLMYCPKRLAFSRPYYEMRNLLAAIDFNEHSDRPVATDRDGAIRYRFYHSKATKRWNATPAKVAKGYIYIRALMARVLSIRQTEAANGIPLSTPVYRPSRGPQKKNNIASVPRPPTAEILAKLQKRY